MGHIDLAGPAIIFLGYVRVRYEGDPKVYLKGNHMHGIPGSVLYWRSLVSDLFNTGKLRASHCAEVRELVRSSDCYGFGHNASKCGAC